MPRRLVTTPEALRGFMAARDWLTQPGSGETGRKRWQRMRRAARPLLDCCYSGATSPAHPGSRLLTSEGYLILYDVRPDTGDSTTAGDIILLAVCPPGIDSRALA